MVKIKIKPLSVNKVWRGRRFKTPEYKAYEKTLGYLLPAYYPIPEGKLSLDIEYGFSSVQSDVDNPTKPLLDILQKQYGFNDSRIYELSLKKQKVKKGEDYIMFTIKPFCDKI